MPCHTTPLAAEIMSFTFIQTHSLCFAPRLCIFTVALNRTGLVSCVCVCLVCWYGNDSASSATNYVHKFIWCVISLWKKKRTCYFRSDHTAVAVTNISVGTGEVRCASVAQEASAKRMNMNIYLLFNVQPANAVRRRWRQRRWQSCKREDVLSDLKSMASVFRFRYGPLKWCLP